MCLHMQAAHSFPIKVPGENLELIQFFIPPEIAVQIGLMHAELFLSFFSPILAQATFSLTCSGERKSVFCKI